MGFSGDFSVFFFSLISLHGYIIIVSILFENHSFVIDDSPYSCFHLGYLDCLERLRGLRKMSNEFQLSFEIHSRVGTNFFLFFFLKCDLEIFVIAVIFYYYYSFSLTIDVRWVMIAVDVMGSQCRRRAW